MKKLFFFSLILSLIFFACRKETFITSPDALVTITADSLKYDTVFTTTGSVTQAFKIINENNQKLLISSIELMGNNNSSFRMNVDGIAGPTANDLEILANDSLYVFVTVTVDPGVSTNPFVIRDSIRIKYNGNTRFVQLEAWGQNAHFYRDRIITGTESWTNDLPYVILGSLIIDTSATLTINKGCRIYVHADAPIIVDGTLLVNGEKDTIDRVSFRPDRLDEPYRDFPGGWPGIFFRGSSQDNIINYAIIKNAYQAIAAADPSPNANPKIILNQCIIDNAYDAGIIAVNSSIQGINTLISNCGKNLLLVKGGDYQFDHCTVVSFTTSYMIHRDPVLLVSNYILVNNLPVSANLDAQFNNCIFWGANGTVEDEVEVFKNGNTIFNVSFNNNLWKVQTPPSNVTMNQIINNQEPEFDSIDVSGKFYDFHLKPSSPAVNAGTASPITIDLDGKPRPVGLPDLGCYERQ